MYALPGLVIQFRRPLKFPARRDLAPGRHVTPKHGGWPGRLPCSQPQKAGRCGPAEPREGPPEDSLSLGGERVGFSAPFPGEGLNPAPFLQPAQGRVKGPGADSLAPERFHVHHDAVAVAGSPGKGRQNEKGRVNGRPGRPSLGGHAF